MSDTLCKDVGGDEPPLLVTKRHRIQLGSISMALGAVFGFFVLPTISVSVLSMMVLGGLRWRVLFVCALTFACGMLWGWHEQPRELNSLVSYRGVVEEEPRWAWSWTTIRLSEGMAVAVRTTGAAPVRFGDAVEATCKEPWTRRAVYDQPQCRDATVGVTAHDCAGVLRTSFHSSRSWLDRKIAQSVPFPEAALLSGILLGGREDLPDTIADAFRTTGTSHIVAVSGYNVSVVVALIAALFTRLPIPRTARLFLTLAMVISFVVLTGSSASVVRAGLMGSMALIGRATGRLGDALHGLILCAALMVVVTPAVAFDIGFQLSVAATFGLVVLSTPIADRLRFVTERFGIRASLATTLAAIAMTQPLIMLYFGTVSAIAPLVNLVVLPLVPLAMLLGACVMTVSMFIPAGGVYVGWIAWLPLRAIIVIVDFGSRVPYASLVLPQSMLSVATAGWALCVAWFFGRSRRDHA